MPLHDGVTFAINGRTYSVDDSTVTPETSLNVFIRDHALLKGTKYMCMQGNCGACVVAVQFNHPVTRKEQFLSINSCLMPVLACHGLSITTVEGVGNKRIGYHNIQKRLAETNGSQCGFCSPGMVMEMYSLLRCNPNFTQDDVERSFGGHVCRCTGYRPILDAFKSLMSNEESCIQQSNKNAASSHPLCSSSECPGEESENILNFVELALTPKSLCIEFKHTNAKWYKVATVFEIMQVLDLIGRSSYVLLAGNTSQGLYPPIETPAVYIDLRDVNELQSYRKYPDHLAIGANMTLTDVMQLFKDVAREDPKMFGYMKDLADHVEMIANVSIRNVATIAGNLSLKRAHPDFSSDVFLILQTAGAKLKINETAGTVQTVSMMEFLRMDMSKKLITTVELPPISTNHYALKTYKIMPRKQNALSLMGAGFLFRILNDELVVEEKPKIIFNGLHSYEAENIITGKSAFDSTVLKDVMAAICKEIPTEAHRLAPSFDYRQKVACSLLYKFLLKVGGLKVKDRFRSGGAVLSRPISFASQDYVANQQDSPVGLPLQKREALAQCSGEVEYVDDIPKYANEVFACYVVADEAAATIHSVDPSSALAEVGIEAFFGASDIPGVNSFGGIPPYLPEHEEIFCSGRVQYAGQPVGILVGKNYDVVKKAARRVVIKYSNKGEALLNVKEVIAKGDDARIIIQNKLEPLEIKENTKHEIEGEYELEAQFHYTLEPLSCLAVPTDIGLKIYPTSQWMQAIQSAVAQSLQIQENQVEVEVKRIGGGFGSKMTRTGQLAAACSLAAFKLHVPVRMVLDFPTSMKTMGKRCPALTKYKVSVDEDGVIQKLVADIYEDYGITLNDPLEEEALRGFQNCYDFKTWGVNVYAVKTDCLRTFARGPGSLEGVASIEHIMDRIAEVTGRDPVEVRLANTTTQELKVIREMVETIQASSNYSVRMNEIQRYNKENRWKKRGMSLVPIKFMICFAPSYYGAVSIFPGDGSVTIMTGGIEMGQGINTKAAQVCAHAMGLDMDKVNVVASRGSVSPGNYPSGSSITSDSVCSAVLSCCEDLKRNFEVLKQKTTLGSWLDLVRAANAEGIPLMSVHSFSPGEGNLQDYPVYGAAVIEVEVDVLTGQYQILRADILEDAGESLNPAIDIGQIEGGFMMGLGYFSSENVLCDAKSGSPLVCNSSDYWPPLASDIPIDFRVTLRKTAPNPLGFLRSKATGEPPLCLACAFPLALNRAVYAARSDSGMDSVGNEPSQPCTCEKTFLACGPDVNQFVLS